jgi:FkbM family methyltransferase
MTDDQSGFIGRKLAKYLRVVKSLAVSFGFGAVVSYGLQRATARLKIRLEIDHTGQIARTNYSGVLETISGDRGISRELLSWGEHEPLTTKLLNDVVKDTFVCVDIGANLGYYSVLEGKRAKKGFLIAIEPFDQSAKALKMNLIRNGISNSRVFQIAISDHDGEGYLLVGERSNLNHLVLEKPDEDIKAQIVLVRKLDSIIQEMNLPRVDLLRMDVEGSEGRIYSGGRMTISRFHPLILMEVHVGVMGNLNTHRLIEQMKMDGYETFYCIPREADFRPFSIFCSSRRCSADFLIGRLDENLVPACFNMLAVPAAR